MAAGSYSSVAAVYDAASGSAAFILSGHKGGLTQVSPLLSPLQHVHWASFGKVLTWQEGACAMGIVVLSSACVRGFTPLLLLLIACSEQCSTPQLPCSLSIYALCIHIIM